MPYKLFDFSLSSFKHHPDMSEETNSFTAGVKYKGKKVGYARNSGRGGETRFDWFQSVSRKDRDDMSDLLRNKEIYYPPGEGMRKSFTVKLNLPELVDELVVIEIALKALKHYISKKNGKRQITFINVDENSENYRDLVTLLTVKGAEYHKPLEEYIRDQKNFDEKTYACINALDDDGLIALAKKVGICADSIIRDREEP